MLLDENDELMTMEGRSVISKDPEGKVGNAFALIVSTLFRSDFALSVIFYALYLPVDVIRALLGLSVFRIVTPPGCKKIPKLLTPTYTDKSLQMSPVVKFFLLLSTPNKV